jgi:hypothetical protein
MSSEGEFDQFLRSADGFGAPTEEDAMRVKARLSSTVSWRRALPAAMASAIQPPRPAASAPRSGIRWRLVKLAALAISVGGLTAATFEHVTTVGPSTSVSDVAPKRAPEDDPRRAPEPDRGASSVPAPPIPTMDGPARLPAAPAAPAPAKSVRRAGTLDAEVALLAETNAALQSKHPARALALVDRHEREFPRGVLGPEFDAQRVLALSALGRNDEACALATRFLMANPGSPLTPQVRSSCNDSDR